MEEKARPVSGFRAHRAWWRALVPAFHCICLVAAACGRGHPARAPLPAIGGVEVVEGWAYPTTQGAGAAYQEIRNTERVADTLVGVDARGGTGMLMGTAAGGMTMLDAIPLAAGAELRMWPGDRHVRFDGLKTEYAIGDSIPLTVRFTRAGAVSVRVPVVAYGELPSPERP